MLLFISAVKLLAELALMGLLGRWVLGWLLKILAPQAPSGNPFLWVLDTVCKPPLWLAARLSPRGVLPQHHVWVALALTAGLWLLATYFKIAICLEIGMERCR